MQKEKEKDITQCFFNAGSYKLEIGEVEAAEKKAAADLKKESSKWQQVLNYRILSI